MNLTPSYPSGSPSAFSLHIHGRPHPLPRRMRTAIRRSAPRMLVVTRNDRLTLMNNALRGPARSHRACLPRSETSRPAWPPPESGRDLARALRPLAQILLLGLTGQKPDGGSKMHVRSQPNLGLIIAAAGLLGLSLTFAFSPVAAQQWTPQQR